MDVSKMDDPPIVSVGLPIALPNNSLMTNGNRLEDAWDRAPAQAAAGIFVKNP
jgi:hypothetical protein